MKKIGVFPGSFDPFTKGHENIIERFLPLFDVIIIGVGGNTSKKYMYSKEVRINHIKSIFEYEPKIVVEPYTGLTVDFCQEKKAQYLLRGLRNTTDFNYEKSIALMNKQLKGIETLFLMTDEGLSHISSTIIRDIAKNNGDLTPFVTNSDKLII
ncbi:MAG TPA: pantetheine-phosphate adenylyltransferase [Crocinitomix sp.]|nr:pantetheine-phosphate adenylyltransferase [Crocinitomix sp.]